MPRPIELVINIDALRKNTAVMRRAAGERTLWAVAKAEAYGHGLKNAVKGFAEADGLAILDIEDAERLRKYGWKKRILMLEGFFDPSDIARLEASGAEVLVHSERTLRMLEAVGARNLKVYIKANTGMNRLGFRPYEVEAVRRRLEATKGVTCMGVITHLANGDPSYKDDGPATVAKQLARLGSLASDPEGACIGATTGMLFHPEVKGTAVRAGIAIYGVSPDSTVSEEEIGVRAAQTLRAGIIAVQNVKKGEAVGYGSKWTAPRDSRVGVVACGYADGYPRIVPNGTPTFVKGRIAPTSGRVCMDMLFIDITDIPEAGEGDWVELWGENIPVNTVAAAAGTIGYELICAILPRVPVRVVG